MKFLVLNGVNLGRTGMREKGAAPERATSAKRCLRRGALDIPPRPRCANRKLQRMRKRAVLLARRARRDSSPASGYAFSS